VKILVQCTLHHLNNIWLSIQQIQTLFDVFKELRQGEGDLQKTDFPTAVSAGIL